MAEKEKLQDELTERRRRSLMIKRFIDEVSVFEDLFTEFSENLWLGLVDVMVVIDKKNFRVKFKSGWKCRLSFDVENSYKGLWHCCCRPDFIVIGKNL